MPGIRPQRFSCNARLAEKKRATWTMPLDLSSHFFSRDPLLVRQPLLFHHFSWKNAACQSLGSRISCLIPLLKGTSMSIVGKKSKTSKRHQRRDDGVSHVPAPNIPHGGGGDGFFSEEAWAGIARKLGLSPRQTQIVKCILADFKDQQIARRLDISPHTVQTHIKRLHEKLAIRSRTGLVTYIYQAHHDWQAEHDPPAGCP